VPVGLLPLTFSRPTSILASVTVMAAEAAPTAASKSNAETIMLKKLRHARLDMAILPMTLWREQPAKVALGCI
jgi:hypothetical protein